MNISGLMKTTLLDYPGHMACTIFTGGCNFRCPFCHNSELLGMDITPEYSEEEIFEFLNKRKHTLEGVAITGGEPTLQKDLPQFIERIRKETGLKIKLDSNGTNPGMLKEMLDAGLLDYVAMDIKSGRKNYLRTSGIKATVDAENHPVMKAVMKSKDMLIEYGNSKDLDYEFRTTVVKGLHSEEDFKDIAKIIKGAKKYFLQSYKDSGNILDKTADFGEPSKEDLTSYLEIVKPSVGSISLRGIDY